MVRSSSDVPTIQELLQHLIADGIQDSLRVSQVEGQCAPTRFPIIVRQETRVVLDKLAERTGGSLAGIAGALLDAVVDASMHSGDRGVR